MGKLNPILTHLLTREALNCLAWHDDNQIVPNTFFHICRDDKFTSTVQISYHPFHLVAKSHCYYVCFILAQSLDLNIIYLIIITVTLRAKLRSIL